MKSASMMAACAAIVVLSLAPQASAQSYTAFPAELCVRVSGPAIYLNGGRLENNDTTQVLSVDCPLSSHDAGNITLGAGVRYRDLHPADVVRCSLIAFRLEGASVVTQQVVRTSDASFVSSEWKNHVFPRPGTGAPGAYFINCRIPPKTSNGRSGIAFIDTFE